MKESWHSEIQWIDLIFDELEARKPAAALDAAREAVDQYPTDDHLLSLAALVALFVEEPVVSLRYLHRLKKRYQPSSCEFAFQAIAMAQQENWAGARALLERHEIRASDSSRVFPPGPATAWGRDWLRRILSRSSEQSEPRPREKRAEKPERKKNAGKDAKAAAKITPREDTPPVPFLEMEPLPRPAAQIPVSFVLPEHNQLAFLDGEAVAGVEDFQLRAELARLALQKGYDDLLCLEQLRGIDHYWYQVETVRKVLKQFRGRVLLADEVGLGKTIEAGMVLKEYMLRGMVERALILTPASLVGQWREEMETKFGVLFSTTYDSLLQKDPSEFWRQPRIIASIAAARRAPHYDLVTRQHFDMVIADEAHHLKSRSTKNWQLVDALQKRFLLLLSATPVQNNLIELYNMLTLLKPGIFKTEREFRSLFVAAGNPRLPANRERLQDLMRDAMIRNTRSLVDVRLPPRHAVTMRVEPSPEERECYAELSGLIRRMGAEGNVHHQLALRHILEASSSSPAACAASLERFVHSLHAADAAAPVPDSAEWEHLRARYARLNESAKIDALLSLLRKNPDEKKMVFARFHETMNRLDELFHRENIAFARFDGHMTGPEKDRAVDEFRANSSVLLCAESGGEGRNLQFCNTLINFDLPWNPQTIEQRIGRLHRIGQQREVFVFNIATRHTVEDRILAILDEKINMFELVVGEVQSILGEMEDEHDFSHMVFKAWIEETEENREKAFVELGGKLADARGKYEEVKSLDDALFGEEFEVV